MVKNNKQASGRALIVKMLVCGLSMVNSVHVHSRLHKNKEILSANNNYVQSEANLVTESKL